MHCLCKTCLKKLGDAHRTLNRSAGVCTKCNRVTCVAELTKSQYEELVNRTQYTKGR